MALKVVLSFDVFISCSQGTGSAALMRLPQATAATAAATKQNDYHNFPVLADGVLTMPINRSEAGARELLAIAVVVGEGRETGREARNEEKRTREARKKGRRGTIDLSVEV